MPENNKLLKPSSEHYQKYQQWLEEQTESQHTRRAYSSRIYAFLQFLDNSGEDIRELIKNNSERAEVVRFYKRYLKQKLKLQIKSINAHLSTIENFWEYWGVDKIGLARDKIPEELPRILSEEEQQRFLAALAECSSSKERAVALTLFHTGIRNGECRDLDVGDVSVDGRNSRILIRSGERYRQIPLSSEPRSALKSWLAERSQTFPRQKMDGALFLSAKGERIKSPTIDAIVRTIGRSCGLELSANQLRNSYLANLVRKQYNPELVAHIAGIRTVESIKRYALMSQEK